MPLDVVIGQGYRPHAKQAAVHDSHARFLAIASGIRGGKSISATVEFLRRIYQDLAQGKGKPVAGHGKRRSPRARYWVIAPTMALARYPYEYLQQYLPPELIESQSLSDYSFWIKPDILIEFKTGERPDLLVGASVSGMLIDEACRMKAEAWRSSLRGRLTDTQGWAIFASSPLGGRNNWLYQEVVAKSGEPGYQAISWKTRDNPLISLDEIEAARASLPDQYFKRDYEASWDSFGGSVYNFTDDHITTEAQFRLEYGLGSRPLREVFRRIVVGVDFGFTSPGAMVVTGWLGDNRFLVLEESYAANRPILGPGTTWLSEAKRLRAKWGHPQQGLLFTCDPARPDALHDLATNGINTASAYNDVYMGIRRCAEALHIQDGRPGMRVLDSCKNTIRELRDYVWKSARDQSSFMEVPADGQSDHAVDATRYAVLELKPVSVMEKPQRQWARPIG